MINLAGNPNCDQEIEKELKLANIPYVKGPRQGGEVSSTIDGIIKTPHGEIKLQRAWYYWVATGPVPLTLAEKIYQHPQGKASVRAGGHCGCVAPSTQVEWLDKEGKLLARKSELEQHKHSPNLYNELLNSPHFRWVEDIEKEGQPFVTMYHIDDQTGLLLFSLLTQSNIL